jgi:hypothetical protein
MNTTFHWLGAIAVVAAVASAPLRRDAARSGAEAPPPCAADSNYQRLAFWVGDWEVVDSTGAHYANQRVRAVLDDCAITAEWTGRAGDKGLNLSAFDRKTGEWRQVYVSNQVPAPSGVSIRRSDPSYSGPGIRFVPLVEAPAGELARSRVTIMPLDGHRALQLFEDSKDGGRTWHVVFRAEHR